LPLKKRTPGGIPREIEHCMVFGGLKSICLSWLPQIYPAYKAAATKIAIINPASNGHLFISHPINRLPIKRANKQYA
jgi:hypothetical protein